MPASFFLLSHFLSLSWWVLVLIVVSSSYVCRRGLSKYYQGKAQSFTSLASVKSIEDLAKKVAPYRRKIKPCKSYGGGLDGGHKSYTTTPKAIISKKASSRGGSFLYSISKRGKLLG